MSALSECRADGGSAAACAQLNAGLGQDPVYEAVRAAGQSGQGADAGTVVRSGPVIRFSFLAFFTEGLIGGLPDQVLAFPLGPKTKRSMTSRAAEY